MDRIDSIEFLAPKMIPLVRSLAKELAAGYETGRTQTLFKVFETFRAPDRQAALLSERTSKAGPWQSAHQFGLAVDFVPWTNSSMADDWAERGIGLPVGWNWHPANDYRFLAARAEEVGLTTPIKWDPCHVQHPSFGALRTVWKMKFE